MIPQRAATPGRRPRPLRLRVAGTGALAIVALAAVLLLGPAQPALAHGPVGIIQPQPPQVDGPLRVTFRLRLIYANDTDPVTSGATVTVQGSGAGGSLGPTTMGYEGKDGYYRATVTFPTGGTWRMTYTAANPAAQHVFDQSVPSPPTTPPPTPPPAPPPTAPPVTPAPGGAAVVTPAPTAPTTTEATSSTTTSSTVPESTSTTAALDGADAPGTTERAATPATTAVPTGGDLASSTITDQPSGGSGPIWALVVGGVVVAGGIAAAVVVLAGRRTPPAG